MGPRAFYFEKGGSLMAEGIVAFSDNRKVKTAFWCREFSKRLYKPPRAFD